VAEWILSANHQRALSLVAAQLEAISEEQRLGASTSEYSGAGACADSADDSSFAGRGCMQQNGGREHDSKGKAQRNRKPNSYVVETCSSLPTGKAGLPGSMDDDETTKDTDETVDIVVGSEKEDIVHRSEESDDDCAETAGIEREKSSSSVAAQQRAHKAAQDEARLEQVVDSKKVEGRRNGGILKEPKRRITPPPGTKKMRFDPEHVPTNGDDDEEERKGSLSDPPQGMSGRGITDKGTRRKESGHSDDDEVFKMQRVWTQKLNPAKRKASESRMRTAVTGDKNGLAEFVAAINDKQDGIDPRTASWCAIWIIIHPNSIKRSIWDLLSLLFVLYDMVSIPFQLFEPQASGFSEAIAWTTRIFWTVDMYGSSVTGYLKSDGSVELRGEKIISKYAKTWCILDLAVVVLDWIEILFATGGIAVFRLGKASRTFRIIRMLRLMRLIRMQHVLKLIAERIRSERVSIITDIIKITLALLFIAHMIACLWYGLGKKADDGGNSWVQHYEMDKHSLAYKYTTSLHWSLAQFTGGMDEVVACNLNERIFAIVVFVIAFVISAIFVSSLTSSMTRLHIISSRQSQQLVSLRRYLTQNGLPGRLAMRVQRNAQHALMEKQRFMPEEEVELLNIVSEPLRVELHFELYALILQVHPFFRSFIEECPPVMRKICHSATSMCIVSCGDIIFNPGETPLQPKMYICCDGKLRFISINGSVKFLHQKSWVSEAVLWTAWMHRGELRATTDSRLAMIDAKMFQDIASTFDYPDFDPRQYAALFVNHLNSQLVAEDEIMDVAPDVMQWFKHITPTHEMKTVHSESWLETISGHLSGHSHGHGSSQEGALDRARTRVTDKMSSMRKQINRKLVLE
jgi:hypothetical protein